MKATKVLGIVLGALLVAALFTGAAAASSDEYSLGDVYVYKLYENGKDLKPLTIANNATWTMGSESITFIEDPANLGKYFISGADVVEGTYSRVVSDKTYTINVKYPTEQVVGFVYQTAAGSAIDTLIGNAVSVKMFVKFNKVESGALLFTNPDGYSFTKLGKYVYDDLTTSAVPLEGLDLGDWTVQAFYSKDTNGYSSLAPAKILGAPYTFTVVKDDTSYALEVKEGEVLEGGYATIVATVPASHDYKIVVSNGIIADGQKVITPTPGDETEGILKVGTSGVETFIVKSTSSDNVKVKIYNGDASKDANTVVKKEISVKVISGEITAAVDGKASVFIGNDVDLVGTNDFGGATYFFIKGPNFDLTNIEGVTGNGKEWTATIPTANLKNNEKKADADSYIVYAVSFKSVPGDLTEVTVDDIEKDDVKNVNGYCTLSLQLKAPFITLTESTTTAVKGESITIKGTAEGSPTDVHYYVFGKNYFLHDSATVNSDNEFEVKINKSTTDKMAIGQYFLVIQHPMYDKKYNIAPIGRDIVLNETADVLAKGATGKILFNVDEKQTENSAKALCNALDSENVDDMYVKISIYVDEKYSFIDSIPEKITKGQVLVVSGKTQGHKDEFVSVEVSLGTFDAKSKYESSAESQADAKTVKIGDDGVWSVSIPTENLVAGDYVCAVSVGGESKKTQGFTIVDSGVTPQPTQTTPVTPTAQPTAQPTATPATPGFGALAALAGLGAVAVLLLRRE